MVEKMQGQPKMTVDGVVGSHILHDNVIGKRYARMLLDIVSRWWHMDELVFMQDGAPLHVAWSNRNFPGLGLGPWEPLAPFAFSLWGWTKEEVFKIKSRIWNNWRSIYEMLYKRSEGFPTEDRRYHLFRWKKHVGCADACTESTHVFGYSTTYKDIKFHWHNLNIKKIQQTPN